MGVLGWMRDRGMGYGFGAYECGSGRCQEVMERGQGGGWLIEISLGGQVWGAGRIGDGEWGLWQWRAGGVGF